MSHEYASVPAAHPQFNAFVYPALAPSERKLKLKLSF